MIFLLCVGRMSATSREVSNLLSRDPGGRGSAGRSARYPRRSPESASWPSSVVPRAAMHLMYYTNEEGHRVYTLKVPPSPAALIVLRCSARGAAHAKRDQASAPLYAHICSLRRKRLRTAGRRNPRTLPASRPMTNSPSSASSARSASACCRCSARRRPCELLRHVRRCAACPTGVHCDLPNTLSSSPCPCIRTVICDVKPSLSGTWKHCRRI